MSESLYNIFLASHQGAWAFLIILFLVAFPLYKAHKMTSAKIVSMILRLFYLIMIISGSGLLYTYGFPPHYLVKGMIALLMIGFMEMALGKAKRGKGGMVGFILAFISALLVVIMGFAG
ncbi:DUF1516 family protein [Natribacillus halophilus]|uniref:Uncharacterized protein n=1 Tax=Natribacillus halophilus TaxID=549003 RepID=A0A1G8QPI4_9BACI|nr:DUF1516 family protein [Natribacillus halophilus]SDJ06000.1 Protein of unknown function [Natribacillus halophilus]